VHGVNNFHANNFHANNFHNFHNFNHFHHHGFNRFFFRPFFGFGFGWPGFGYGGYGYPYYGYDDYPYYGNDWDSGYAYPSAYYAPVTYPSGYYNGAGPYNNGYPMPIDDNATFPYNGDPKNPVPDVGPSEQEPSSDPEQKILPQGQFVKAVSASSTFLAYGEQPTTKVAPASSASQPTPVAAPARVLYPAYGEPVADLPLLTQSKR
jgi:hypothetical protein